MAGGQKNVEPKDVWSGQHRSSTRLSPRNLGASRSVWSRRLPGSE
jgi:hypothetical protein